MVEQKSNDHSARITRNEKDIQDLWKITEEIRKIMAYRPPLWCTFALMALSSALTGFIVRALS